MKETYIWIFEDGTAKKGPEPTQDDLDMVDSGCLQIINTDQMTDYSNGYWEDLMSVTEDSE